MNGSALVAGLLVVSALGVARLQPRLAHAVHVVKENDDVNVLPPPAELKALTLGYDATTADILWSQLLVQYGMHWQERRNFHPDPYIDAILGLDPTLGSVYRFADTLLCYRPLHGTDADARKTRLVLEEGTRQRPWDYEVWLEYGQFLAFLAPSFLTAASDAEKDAWRRDGALAIMKAVELGADSRLGLSAATVLQRSGETRAAIEGLLRDYAVNHDDPEKAEEIKRKLTRLSALQENDAQEKAMGAIDSAWRAGWDLLPRTQVLLLGPMPDVARCAGLAADADPSCAHDWTSVLEGRAGAPDPSH